MSNCRPCRWAPAGLLIILSFLISVRNAAAAVSNPSSPEAAGPSSEAASGEIWQSFKSVAGKFIVSLPDDPKKLIVREQKEKGSSEVYHQFILRTRLGGVNAAFLLTYQDSDAFKGLKPAEVHPVMMESLKSALGPFYEHLAYKRRVQIDGNPGIEYRYWANTNNVKVVFTGRFILVHRRRWFHLSAIMPEPLLRSGSAAKFLNSFKLLR